jgi:hypothetical protein
MERSGGWKSWLLWTLATVVVIGAALVVRERLRDWTTSELSDRLVRRIAALSEERAVAEVRELAALDADAPVLLLPLLADQREPVAASAREAVDRLVDDWRRVGGAQAAPRVARLARELAAIAPRLPEKHVSWAQSLAERLLIWPTSDPELSASIIGDCEIVLRLPSPEASEVRLAAAERTIEPDVVEVAPPPPLAPELPGTMPAASAPQSESIIPRVYGPVEPARLPDASQERPERPKQFLPPRAMRIDG